MKIGTNPVGNYKPVYRKPETTQVNTTKPVETKPVINDKEKLFFSDKYPQNKEQIMNHHFYMKNGNMSGVTIGSLFDKRG
ncbi:MAG: hypothetical protein CVV23_15355 [Ignavibacteriae bacterium HGW-Ignavibacteriae-2]|jgi:hypothetical protein|nr:hypothetical protein [Bacteroidota bacterium]PKL87419.1 MAG: hypothetical protein CVV23_15355 [Ignavibacteriae bacterium HGW-Ignavibacteriae-2]